MRRLPSSIRSGGPSAKTPDRVFRAGLATAFAKKAGQFRPGEFATVEAGAAQRSSCVARTGELTVLQPARAPSAFEVGQKRELPVASGDRLLLQANGHGFTNGERVQVKALGRGGIALADGRTLPASYRSFTHGHAVTSHAAQGKTVDVALFVASSRSFAAVSRESFYVGISRGREQVRIFTDDAATLERRVEETHTRKAALERQGLREEMARHGLLRLREEEEKRLTRFPLLGIKKTQVVDSSPGFSKGRDHIAICPPGIDLGRRLRRKG